MSNFRPLAFCFPLLGLLLCACPDGGGSADAGVDDDAGSPGNPYAYPADYEAQVQLLPLATEAASSNFEYSGLGWFGDVLIVLPEASNAAWAIEKSALESRIDGADASPLSPKAVAILPDLGPDNIPNFDGFEAITFVGSDVYLSIETSGPLGGGGYMLRGIIEDDLSAMVFDLDTLTENPTPVPAESNSSYEAIVAVPDGILTLFELNGALVNNAPTAALFDASLETRSSLVFPALEYRVTDATRLDGRRFWAMNFRFPGDGRAVPNPEALVAEYGQGETHAQYAQVERLVEMQYRDGEVTLVDRPPLQLFLPSDWTVDGSRNWEGVVRLDERGFIVVTDRFPTTMLGFVPLPNGQ